MKKFTILMIAGLAGIITTNLFAQTSTICNGLPSDLNQNLVAYYPFCGNANDISGNNNHPSVVNATLATDRFGNPSSAYSFNGTTQYIKGSCSNFPANSRTVSAWFKINDLSRHNEILGYGGNGCGTTFMLVANLCVNPNAFSTQAHCVIDNCSSTNGYPPSGWNNWIVTSGNNVTKFYINGVLTATFNNVDYNGTYVAGKEFAFGSIPSTSGIAPYKDGCADYLDGSLDDIVIYNAVLDDAQVQNLYQFFSSAAEPSCFIPSGETTANISGTSAKLKWDAVADAEGYKVRYQVANTHEWKIRTTDNHSRTINGLLPNTLYQWEVKTYCQIGPNIMSAWSSKQEFTTGSLRMSDEQPASLELYPNLVSENFTLDLKLSTTTDQSVDIFLLNSIGQIVYTYHELTSNGELQKVIYMPSTATMGWYVVRVMMNDQVLDKKLMYQK